MPAYLTLDRFKLLSTVPPSFVAEVEATQSGYVDGQLAYWSDWIDAQLRKRYAAPFLPPIPLTLEGWLARIVTVEVWSRRGVDPNDLQWEVARQSAADARAEIDRAANGETGLYDLPLRAGAADSGIVRAFPRGYSEASPYVGVTQQAVRGVHEDESGSGSFT